MLAHGCLQCLMGSALCYLQGTVELKAAAVRGTTATEWAEVGFVNQRGMPMSETSQLGPNQHLQDEITKD